MSSFFADIFRGNALNNGLLPVMVSEDFLAEMFARIEADASTTFTVDLPAQTITIDATGRSEKFDIDAYKKKCLLGGFDDVDYLRSISDQIEEYEKRTK